MNDLVKEFIEKNVDLIENNLWKEFYKRADKKLSQTSIMGELGYTLIEAGIDPLLYITHVPGAYAAYSTIKSIIIPDNIIYIGSQAFQNCKKLTYVEIGVGVKRIDSFAFGYCSQLKSIKYGGTMELWNHIKLELQWNGYKSVDGYNITKIICKDGSIDIIVRE